MTMLFVITDMKDDKVITGYLTKHLEICGFAIYHNMTCLVKLT